MITVKVNRNEGKEIVSFTMSGHADAGPYGYDIVCAGASAVSIGTINAMIELCQIEPHLSMEEDGGYLHFEVPNHLEDNKREKVQLLLEAMLVSLRSIEEEYSNHIRIKDETRR